MKLSLKSRVGGLIAFLLFLLGCNHKDVATEQRVESTQPFEAAEVPSQPARPKIEIAGDPIFVVTDDELLTYSEGWNKLQAEADARAASFESDEMKAQARAEVLGRADKSALEAEAQANIRQSRLTYIEEHPNAAFVVGFYEQWTENLLTVGCPPKGYPLLHSSCGPSAPLAAHVRELSIGVTPTEMDAALTEVLKDHDSEFNRDQEIEAKNFLDQAGEADSQEDVIHRAKDDIYPSYLACALVGEFRPELVDNEEPTPESLSRRTRKAYLVDSSNGNILVELSNPWGYLHPER